MTRHPNGKGYMQLSRQQEEFLLTFEPAPFSLTLGFLRASKRRVDASC